MSKKFILILICLIPLINSCRTNSASQRQNQVEKQREEKDRQAEKLYEEGKEKHLKNQTKDTRIRMKANKEKSSKASYIKKECFLKRWFSHKPNTCPKSSE
ncbi:MAG: hypothetical protein HXX18_07470 [Bacteroidetes bacterium]|nr:hypothetical protein [Bacteroidota bacterium]